jgi:uncharacterized protein DUF998
MVLAASRPHVEGSKRHSDGEDAMTTIGLPEPHRHHAWPTWTSMTLREVLLVCGILSSLLYVAMNVIVALQWPGYSVMSQTVSELSAIGAPTRWLWAPLGAFYTVLVTAFGFGVIQSAAEHRALRVGGILIVIYGALGLASERFCCGSSCWPFSCSDGANPQRRCQARPTRTVASVRAEVVLAATGLVNRTR